MFILFMRIHLLRKCMRKFRKDLLIYDCNILIFKEYAFYTY
jgi:hypothetical protein